MDSSVDKQSELKDKKLSDLSVTEIKAIMLDHILVIERSNNQITILKQELQRRDKSGLRTSTQGTSNGG